MVCNTCRFKLGHSAPKLRNFNSFKNSERTDDAMVAVECDVDWHSESVCTPHLVLPALGRSTFVIMLCFAQGMAFHMLLAPCYTAEGHINYRQQPLAAASSLCKAMPCDRCLIMMLGRQCKIPLRLMCDQCDA